MMGALPIALKRTTTVAVQVSAHALYCIVRVWAYLWRHLSSCTAPRLGAQRAKLLTLEALQLPAVYQVLQSIERSVRVSTAQSNKQTYLDLACVPSLSTCLPSVVGKPVQGPCICLMHNPGPSSRISDVNTIGLTSLLQETLGRGVEMTRDPNLAGRIWRREKSAANSTGGPRCQLNLRPSDLPVPHHPPNSSLRQDVHPGQNVSILCPAASVPSVSFASIASTSVP